MLNQDEWDYVIERLTVFAGGYDKPREMLVAPFVGTTVAADLIGGSPAMMVPHVVRLCVADAWNHEPPWLVLLLDLMPIRDTDPKLVEIRDRVAVKPPPGPNRLDATVLDNGTPFVNRVVLRRHLKRLAAASAAAKPILVVNGSVQSGKSYSTQYIEHFSLVDTPPSTTYRMELKQGIELETGPEEVATELVGMMGRDTKKDKPQPNTNQKLYAQQLARWVLNEAVQAPTEKHWIMLDNFQGEKLRPDTRDFVVALADMVTNGVFPRKCRLILIGFDRAHLTVDPGKVDEERIAACLPTDVEGCVREIARRAPVVLAVQPLLDFVMNGLPAGAQWMRELNGRLRGLLAAVDRITEIAKDLDLRFEEVLHAMLEELPSGADLMTELQKRLDRLSESAADLRAS